ncbi:hypothetical protein MMC14_001909 [Varicellaria rhodocarpa]|nr:hypothetical protein [Varicellaria rhodocarpa]
MDPYVDIWNMEAYDYAGSWDTLTGHQANLYPSTSNPNSTPFNTQAALAYYNSQGISSSKIVLGMPLYGRAFDSTTGMGQPFNGVGSGSWENGVWDFKVLPQAGAREIIDQQAGASYSQDTANQIIISYDNLQMTAIKTNYILTQKMAGSMWWEVSGDRTGSGSLIAAAYNGMEAAGPIDSTQNTLSYPNSQYDNLRAGMPSG